MARPARVRVARRLEGRIRTWTHPPHSVTPTEALHYFVELSRDFLDPSHFDLIPFDVLHGNRELQAAMHDDFATQIAAAEYRALLEDAIEDLRDNAFSPIKIPQLVEMVNAQVPADALAKVQRRFRLLDRGPASIRRQPKVSKSKRGSKS